MLVYMNWKTDFDTQINKIRDLFKVKLNVIRSETIKKEKERKREKEWEREKKERERERDREKKRERKRDFKYLLTLMGLWVTLIKPYFFWV